MKLKDISRTASFAWDVSSSSSPLIATGAIAGALDESFSNDSQLEIWAPDFGEGQGLRLGGEGNKAEGSITVGSRFNRLAWSAPAEKYARGVLAAGMETGEINVFDPAKILDSSSADEARIFKSDKHTGPVRGLEFNPIQKNLLLSGATNAELFIFDLNNPTNAPIPPGSKSTKLNEITSLQWNPTVSRVFAASSSSGFTSVWDLKAGKEIVSLQYGGGAAKGMETVGGIAGLQMGKRRGMSDVCWHPEQATRLITASEDDESPIIMLWDLRNTRAPERILSGHHKGVLSVAWCRQDADLLLSCGKDNRTLCWNPQTGEIIGELPASTDWSFQTSWCPRNPDLLATASFDGHIGIHSLQTTQSSPQPSQTFSETATADEVFGALGNEDSAEEQASVLSLKQPPKWLRRPVSASFGFGGLLASTSNLPGANGKHQSGVVHLRSVVTEQGIVHRAIALHDTAHGKEKMMLFCTDRVSDAAWKTLQTLFKANSREELVQLLGFSKEDVAKQVAEAVKKFPALSAGETDTLAAEPKEEVLAQPSEAPSEVSAASESGHTESSVVTEQSLFTDVTPGTPAAAAADFFSSMATGNLRNPQLDNVVPNKADGAASSVAATIGSRASSVRSEAIKDSDTFQIYPPGESDVDRLVTQSLVIGDFASAVNLCLASERFADALILAFRGGAELLQSTQKAYFARRTTSLPFLRVFQSIVMEDLTDIVQNADLDEWKVILVVLCTFAKEADFNHLAEQLGQRLQFRWQTMGGSDSPEAKINAKAAREDATLCFLAARRLENVVSIWIDEMKEEEDHSGTTKYTAHAQALQSFIEKVAVFTAATSYIDKDLMTPTESAATAEAGTRTYKLAGLYDRYYEYADLLATQGLLDIAANYVRMTPSDYKGTGAAGFELDKARDRLLSAAGESVAPIPAVTATTSERTQSTAQAAPTVPSAPYAAGPAPSVELYRAPVPPVTSSYNPPQSYGYTDPNPYAPSKSQPYGTSNGYGPPDQGYAPQSYGAPPAPPPSAPPPRSTNGASVTDPPVPAAFRRDMPGWNDVPSAGPKRPGSAIREGAKPAPIMSPFPVSSDPMASTPSAGSQGIAPPPARSAQPGMLPPPPRGGPRPPSAQAVARQASSPPQQTPPPGGPPVRQPMGRGGPAPGVLAGPPPQRALSPLGPGRKPSPQARAPLMRALSPPGPAPPPGSRLAGPPPPGRTPPIAPPTAPPTSNSAPAPSKPTYPSGDRSHTASHSRPIYDTLSAELNRVKQSNLPAHLKRIVDDTERRLNILFDGLNNETVPKPVVDQMSAIAKAMVARDMNAALAMHVELLTNATGDMTAWAPGVKQLIRLGL